MVLEMNKDFRTGRLDQLRKLGLSKGVNALVWLGFTIFISVYYTWLSSDPAIES